MAKKTWVNISGTFREVKNVWVNVAGVWKEKVIPKGNLNGAWKEFMLYMFNIYTNGFEAIPIVLGINGGASKITKNTTNIFLQTAKQYMGANGNMTAVTDSSIDLTNYKTLYLTLEAVSSFTSQTQRDMFLGIGLNKSDVGNVTRRKITNADANSTISLDVSSLSGNFYVNIHLSTPDQSNINLAFNHLWLE